MEFHILSELFPELFPEQKIQLSETVKESGSADSVILFEEKILYGRDWYLACLSTDTVPTFEIFDGNPLEFLVSHNIDIDHLTEHQFQTLCSWSDSVGKDVNQVMSELRFLCHKAELKKIEYIIKYEKDIITGNPYDCVILDPPWAYGTQYNPETRRVGSPYPEMTTPEIREKILSLNLFKSDCVLWLWTTHRFIWDAKQLLIDWGFEYKAILVWDKESIGMGHWFRMQTEFCLFGIRGAPLFNNTSERDIIYEKRREHSRKPEAFYNLVRKTCKGTIFEYFSREKRDGIITAGVDKNLFVNTITDRFFDLV